MMFMWSYAQVFELSIKLPFERLSFLSEASHYYSYSLAPLLSVSMETCDVTDMKLCAHAFLQKFIAELIL